MNMNDLWIQVYRDREYDISEKISNNVFHNEYLNDSALGLHPDIRGKLLFHTKFIVRRKQFVFLVEKSSNDIIHN